MTKIKKTIKQQEDSLREELTFLEKKEEIDQDSLKMAKYLLKPNVGYHEKLTYIKNELEQSTSDIEFSYTLSGFLEDTAYAIHRAVEKIQGFSSPKGEKSPSKDNPPEMVDVKFADGTRIKVPVGKIDLPQFGTNSYIDTYYDFGNQKMLVEGVCQKRHTELMDSIIEEAEHILATDSIYKNKAIKYDGGGSPSFIDLSNVDNIELFLTSSAKFNTLPIEARIEKSEECIKKGIDLKFGVLLEGQYGTGKTLYANKLASKAIKNGWTFIYSSKPENTLEVLKMANKFTKNGRGVVLFIEDIDKILNKRDSITNEISLLMDGSETKHNNIISIFSTNHLENIDPTFLRGKRIGSLVTLGSLDKETAKEMLHYHLGDYIEGDYDLASQKVEDYNIVPAFLSEIIDRVKTHTILADDVKLTEQDIISAIDQYKRQMEIAKVKTNMESKVEQIARLKSEILKEEMDTILNENDTLDTIYNNVN